MTNILGTSIRAYREEKKLLLREVAAAAKIDTALLSKIECGKKRPKEEVLLALSNILEVPNAELFTNSLVDQIYDIVKGKTNAIEALMMAVKLYDEVALEIPGYDLIGEDGWLDDDDK